MFLGRLISSTLTECPLISSACIVAALCLFVYMRRRTRMVELMKRIPGPPGLPIVGNCVEINVGHDEIFERLIGGRSLWGRSLGYSKAWLGNKPYVFISKATVLEPILSSMKHIEKSEDYLYLQPWLGTGLLTSSGSKWQIRRKIMTPAFHFRILDDFIDVFREQSLILVNKLKEEEHKDAFNIFPYVTLCALDIVCETAMGRQVNAQRNSNSEYVRAVYKIGEIVQTRQAKIWLQPDWLFKLSPMYKKHQKCINVLHSWSYKVINERTEEVKKTTNGTGTGIQEDTSVLGKKKRLAFLDLLIEASQNGTLLSTEDIREEVDTFMFEGHDTTSAAICWLLFLLGWHPDIQELVFAELNCIFGDSDRHFNMTDLTEMKYLECCIKEALRLYPSVPIMARKLEEDVVLGSHIVPAGTTAMIITYMLHRDPEIYPDPERFDPDRFLPINCRGRHPYSYIPFSAGPRNCVDTYPLKNNKDEISFRYSVVWIIIKWIKLKKKVHEAMPRNGQKFAMLEEKAVVSTILRKYRVESVDRREDLTLLGELILRPKDGLRIKIFPRCKENPQNIVRPLED